MSKRGRVWVIVVVVAALTATPARRAAAEGDESLCGGFGFISCSVYASWALSASIVVGGMVTAIGGGYDFASGHANANWRQANYIFAGFNFGFGLTWALLAATVFSDSKLIAIPFVVAHGAVGVLDLGLAISSSRRAATQPPVRILVVPVAGRAANGSLMSGLGVRLSF